MKYLTFLVAIFCCQFAMAQDNNIEQIILNSTTKKEPKNEVGIMLQGNFGENKFKGNVLLGLQYKKWFKPSLGFRFFVAYNPYDFTRKSDEVTVLNNDSTWLNYQNYQAECIAIGLCFETQKRFHKHIYLTTGFDISASYGKGKYYTYSYLRQYQNGYVHTTSNIRYNENFKDYSKYYITANPFVGAKMVYSKFVCGLDFFFMNQSVHFEKVEGKERNIYPFFDIFANASCRLYFNFRFHT